jgi:DNA-binding MarR family transcriptional regulator
MGNSIGFALRIASSFATQQFHKAMHAVHLRPAQFTTMVLIAENPGVMQKELCDVLGIEKANFVSLLDILEERKLIERRPEMRDRRRHAIFLTQRGHAVLRKAVIANKELEDLFRSRLPAREIKRFVANLERFR